MSETERGIPKDAMEFKAPPDKPNTKSEIAIAHEKSADFDLLQSAIENSGDIDFIEKNIDKVVQEGVNPETLNTLINTQIKLIEKLIVQRSAEPKNENIGYEDQRMENYNRKLKEFKGLAEKRGIQL